MLGHLKAACFELPFEPGERFGPGEAEPLLAFLAEEGLVRRAADDRWYWSNENFPASSVSLRGCRRKQYNNRVRTKFGSKTTGIISKCP